MIQVNSFRDLRQQVQDDVLFAKDIYYEAQVECESEEQLKVVSYDIRPGEFYHSTVMYHFKLLLR